MADLTLPILTERLLLRRYIPDDVETVLGWERRLDVHRYLYSEPRSREEVVEAIAQRTEMTGLDSDSHGLRLAVERRDTGRLIGDVGIQRVGEPQHLTGEIGFVFDPGHHGHGFATEATAVLPRHAFEDAGLHRITGRCDARNARSAGVMGRLGMRREAHLVENEWIKGEWTDELTFAMLAEDWHKRREEAG